MTIGRRRICWSLAVLGFLVALAWVTTRFLQSGDRRDAARVVWSDSPEPDADLGYRFRPHSELWTLSPALPRRGGSWSGGTIAAAAAVEPLCELLEDSDPRVRRTAAWGLAWIGSSEAVGPLVEATKDSDPDTREQAAFALGALGDEGVLPALRPTLRDPDPYVRRAAA